ncbi:MAG TPA: hypothetical protein VK503_04140 [Candidatus Bathyarchaeia archaeon]|nr:hypothetical protein [Candidatus Bathyarchaeia archaeon]
MTIPFSIYEGKDSREKLQVNIPLETRLNVENLRSEIGIPDYVDLTNFQMTKIVAVLWSLTNRDAIGNQKKDQPVKVALFGGGAFKLYCPSANRGPLSRRIGDIDLVTLRENGKQVVDTLCALGDKYGSMFYHGVPEADKRFNALRTGMRYRIRTIKDTDENGKPVPGVMDIFCDKLTFCHTLDVRNELMDADKHMFTIGLENLIISKSQYIAQVPKSDARNVDPARIMGDYNKKHVLVGMEQKDMRDVSALLLDHNLGEGPQNINVHIMGEKLKRDWGLWKTVTLSLKNMHEKLDTIFSSFGASKQDRSIVGAKLRSIIEQLETTYAAEKGMFSFNKQWWEDVEEQSQQSAHM